MDEFEKRLFSGEAPVSTDPDGKGEASALSLEAIAKEAEHQASLAVKPEATEK